MIKDTQLKIMAALEDYMHEHDLSQNDVVKKTGVNSAYIVAMRKGESTLVIGGKTTEISDRYFKKISDFIGFDIDKQYWKTKNTPQFLRCTSELIEAKRLGETTVIIGATGSGKTLSCERIAKKYPKDFFHIVVSQSDNLASLVDKVSDRLSVSAINSRKSVAHRLKNIVQYLRDLEFDGYEPMIAFDESEYMKQPALCAMKELHDALNGQCAVGIIGTPQLLSNIDKMVKCNRQGIPQFYRRIKYRIRELPAIDRNYPEFLNGRFDKELENWLKRNAYNYGELCAILLPALRESDRTGEPVTLDFVEKILGIVPKRNGNIN